MKLMLDSPYHTDWMLGAGLDLTEDYGFNSPVTNAAHQEMFRLQDELGDFEVTVLSDCGPVTGIVGAEIAVLPDLTKQHTEIALKSKALIAEQGGMLAHLTLVGMKAGITIFRVPDAIARYPKGTLLTLLPAEGTIINTTNKPSPVKCSGCGVELAPWADPDGATCQACS